MITMTVTVYLISSLGWFLLGSFTTNRVREARRVRSA